MTINISITESAQQIVANVPKWLIISTDIPATIFYTFNNVDPSTSSDIFADRLFLPTDQNPLIVKIWATNGSDQSEVITQTYSSTLVGARIIRADATNYGQLPFVDQYPFGSSSQPNPPIYGVQVGTTTNSFDQTPIPDGYDGFGNQVGSLDQPKSEYTFFYSETNRKGERGRGIGTVPSVVTIRLPEPPPESSSTNDKFFNPKALVIYQDSRDTENSDLNFLNRSNEGSKTHGSALKPHFNPKDQTLTFYYRDSLTNKWIISTEPFKATGQPPPNNILIGGRQQGAGFVFPYYPFLRKRIV